MTVADDGVDALLDGSACGQVVLTVVAELRQRLPGCLIEVKQGDGDVELEPVALLVHLTGEAGQEYERLTRFDREWWLLQPRATRQLVGVYVA